MKKFMKSLKRTLVLALTVALIGNSVDLSTFYVQAEGEQSVVESVSGSDVSDGNVQTDVSNTAEDSTAVQSDAGSGENAEPGDQGELMFIPIEEWYDLPEVETSAMQIGFFSLEDGVVSLKDGNYEEWIDRIDLSGDATVIRDFYDKLIEWTDNDGTEDWLITGETDMYAVAEASGAAEVTDGMTALEVKNAVMADAGVTGNNYLHYITAAINAFDRDYPEVFWLTGGSSAAWSVSYYDSGSLAGQYTATIYVRLCGDAYDMRKTEYQDAAAIRADIAEMNADAEAILANAEDMSTVEKLTYFNEWLTENNEYNTIVGGSASGTAPLSAWEATSSLSGSTGTNGPVCEGYARAFKILCDKSGIPCVLVDGHAKNDPGSAGEGHMWNYVQVRNAWYAVDATWNDPVVSGVSGATSGYESEKWFLVGSATDMGDGFTFIESHPVSNTVSTGGVSFTNGPVLSADVYVEPPHDHDGISTEWIATNGTVEAGKYYLSDDVTATNFITIDGDVTLCLNGYALDMDSDYMEIAEGASLTICDCAESGKVTCSGYLTIYPAEDSEFILLSGTIENTNADGISINSYEGSVTTIEGGTIKSSSIGIWNDGTLYLTGGSVEADEDGVFQNGTMYISGAPVITSGEGCYDLLIEEGKAVGIVGALTGTDTYSFNYYGTSGTFAVGASATGGTAYTLTAADMAKFVIRDEYEEYMEVLLDNNSLVQDYKKCDVSGQIIWNDEEDLEGFRPNSVLVTLYANGSATDKSVYATAANNWKYTFEDIYQYDSDGDTIAYTVAGATVSSYNTPVVNGYNITYTHTTTKLNIDAEIAWNDDADRDGKRPDSLTVKLYANYQTAPVATKTVNAASDWSASFTGMPKYKNGLACTYYLKTDDYTVAGYDAATLSGDASNGFTVGLAHTPETVSFSVSVVDWEEENADKRPANVSVTVQADGESVGTLSLRKEASYLDTFNGYKYQNGEEIVYTLGQISDTYYKAIVTGSAEEDFEIVMTLKHWHEISYVHPVSGGVEQKNILKSVCVNEEEKALCEWTSETVQITAPGGLIYDGTAKAATLTNNLSTDATVSGIVYYVQDGSTWTEVAASEVVDAGTYKAVVTVTDDGEDYTAEATFEIAPADLSAGVIAYTGTFDPFGQAPEAVEATVYTTGVDAEISYSVDGGATWTKTVPTISGAGSLDVKVKISAENYMDYVALVTAEVEPFDISYCEVTLDKDVYYYTGEEVEPKVASLKYDEKVLPLTAADYKLSYENNVAVTGGTLGEVTVTADNDNYTGSVTAEFPIGYYDGAVTPLYNGEETPATWYNSDVAISAEGYTVSATVDGEYTDSVALTGEGISTGKTLYFKQDGTGYITDGMDVYADIDRTAPYYAEGQGISIQTHTWNTLLNKITFGILFKETQEVIIDATDDLSGTEKYYYYIDKSGSETVKTAEELDKLTFTEAASGRFTMADDSKYVVYAYVTDTAGNRSAYICSDGIIMDTMAPVLKVTAPTEAEGTLKDTSVTFTVEANEDVMIGVGVFYDYSGEEFDGGASVGIYDAWNGMEADKQVETDYAEHQVKTIQYKTQALAKQPCEITITGLEPNADYHYAVWAYDITANETIYAGELISEDSYKTLTFTTLKTIPAFAADPAISGTYGQKLGEMTLNAPTSTNGVAGSWSIAAASLEAMPVVNGTTAYDVTFTPDDTDSYETVTKQVIPVVAKKAITATVDNQTVKYNEAIPALTYTVTGLVGTDTKDVLNIKLSTIAVKGSDAGEYAITGSYNSANYDVSFTEAAVTIEKADAVITVESGKDVYSKTFGDDDFALGGISTNSDATLLYEVVSAKDASGQTVAAGKVATVDALGNVSVEGAGSAVIRISAAMTNNYNAAESKEITVNIAKATEDDASISEKYLYLRANQESIDLTDYVPADAGTVGYQVGTVSDASVFTAAPAVANGKLTYTVSAGEIGDSASFAVTVSSDNYEDYVINVTVTLEDQTSIEEKNGKEVSLKNNTLTYGDALSKLEFNEAVFVITGTSDEVSGKLTWETPALEPTVATTKATWVFTPDDIQYKTVTGEIAIVVKKATQPAFNIVEIADIEYFPGGAERTLVETEGGLETGIVTISVPADNGVIRLDDDNQFAVLAVGKVTITAVCTDPDGNYEDATATFELTVTPYQLTASQIKWEDGVTGVETYDGTAQKPEIWMYMISGRLTEGTDYTVEYVNNTNAYTLTESDAGFAAGSAPTVVVTGKGNYAGTVKKYFVINKADAAINVAAGKDVYNKTYGDDSFALSGISKVGDGTLTYAVTDSKNAAGQAVAADKVVTVDATGKVTVVGAGSAVITVNMAETDNYKAAEAVTITVNVAKATVSDVNLSRAYVYVKEHADSIDLKNYIPTDAGNVTYQVGEATGTCSFAVAPSVANGTLSYTAGAGEKDAAATFAVTISSDNYKAFAINVTVTLADQIELTAKKVSLKNDTLVYGEALSKLEFKDAEFVIKDTGKTVPGKIAWETPDRTPDVATTKAVWVFTPDDNDYMTTTGEIAIVVEKAVQPTFSIVELGETEFAPGKEVTVAATGGCADGKVTFSVPAGNKVAEVSADGTVKLLGVGTVTITAVKMDNTGNYKDATATYDLVVTPCNLKAENLAWATGFNGAVTYTGQEQKASIAVTVADVTLVEGTDYTITFANNVNAYTLSEADADFDASKAPAVMITGMGNYTGVATKYFIINKAENAPNMPEATKTVGNRYDTTGTVSLPEGWAWQDAAQALAEGANTAFAVYNGADRGNYVNELATITITRLEAGLPYVSGVNGEEVDNVETGWDVVQNVVDNTAEGGSITIDMNGVSELPGDVIDSVKGKDITIVLDMNEYMDWSINGKTVTAEDVADIDMQLALDSDKIPAEVLSALAGENESAQLGFADSGDLGFTAVLSVNVGSENAGWYAKLYRYNETANALVYVGEALISAEGLASLSFTAADNYAIVIDDEQYKVPGSDNDDDDDESEESTAPTSPKTSDDSIDWRLLFAANCLTAGICAILFRRKRDLAE